MIFGRYTSDIAFRKLLYPSADLRIGEKIYSVTRDLSCQRFDHAGQLCSIGLACPRLGPDSPGAGVLDERLNLPERSFGTSSSQTLEVMFCRKIADYETDGVVGLVQLISINPQPSTARPSSRKVAGDNVRELLGLSESLHELVQQTFIHPVWCSYSCYSLQSRVE